MHERCKYKREETRTAAFTVSVALMCCTRSCELIGDPQDDVDEIRRNGVLAFECWNRRSVCGGGRRATYNNDEGLVSHDGRAGRVGSRPDPVDFASKRRMEPTQGQKVTSTKGNRVRKGNRDTAVDERKKHVLARCGPRSRRKELTDIARNKTSVPFVYTHDMYPPGC